MNESALIDAIAEVLSRSAAAHSDRVRTWIGDDCAVVRADEFCVTSVDVMVDGTHFRFGSGAGAMRAFDVGYRAVAGAVSDVAAMGAAPGEIYLAIVLPDALSADDVVDLHRGALAVADLAGMTIAGGDLVRGSALTVAVTATGWAASEDQVVRRSGGRAGDLVGVTGSLGGSVAGLSVLTGKASGSDSVVDRYLHPPVRVGVGKALARAGATAMLDLSDGLATDARRLGEASSVSVVLDARQLPINREVTSVAKQLGVDAVELTATGGEDYELLVCIPPTAREAAERAAGEAGLTWIGELSAGAPGVVWNNAPNNADNWRGWELET